MQAPVKPIIQSIFLMRKVRSGRLAIGWRAGAAASRAIVKSSANGDDFELELSEIAVNLRIFLIYSLISEIELEISGMQSKISRIELRDISK